MKAPVMQRLTTASIVVITGFLVSVTGAPADAALADNGKIAFSSNRSGSFQIWSMDRDGSNPTQLTDSLLGNDEAAWSPDGTKIAFASGRDGLQRGQLYVMNADGSSETRLPSVVTGLDVAAPAWSPDGTKIAYEANGKIYVIGADGLGNHQVNTTWAGGQGHPSWSPDGTRIYFEGLSPDKVHGTFWMYADGTGAVTRLTTGVAANTVVSPDGSLLAYNSAPFGPNEIFLVSTAGGFGRSISSGGDGESEPNWSPDGTRMVFHQNTSNNVDIYSIRSSGGDLRRLTTHAAIDVRPAWQPTADVTGPYVSCSPAGQNHWLAGDDAVSCTAYDPVSGLADPSQQNFQLPFDVPDGTADSNAFSGSFEVCDTLGNCTTAGPIGPFAVDRARPTVSLVSPAAQTYVLNEPVVADYDCDDVGSGTFTCAGSVPDGDPVVTGSVGAATFQVAAQDLVGNSATVSVGYVVAYGVQVLSSPTRPTRKVIFRLVDADGANVGSSAITVTARSVDGNSPAPAAIAFSARTGEYTFVVPPRFPSGDHTLEFTAGADPTTHTVAFRVR